MPTNFKGDRMLRMRENIDDVNKHMKKNGIEYGFGKGDFYNYSGTMPERGIKKMYISFGSERAREVYQSRFGKLVDEDGKGKEIC